MGSVVVNKASKRGVIAAAIAGMALVSWPSKAPAADKWWDPTGNAAGTGGTGNWDTTSSFWSTNSAGTSVTTWSNTNDAANFNAVGTLTLTTAISALERELGGALFHRKPSIALTGLGRMVRPYLDEIARNAGHVRELARTLTPRPSAHRSARQAVDSS